LNFDGQQRNDANHAGNPQYVPNSFKHKFRPDTAEAPYLVSDNIVSRKSHYYHEGKLSDYDQARELYKRVMNQSQRDNLYRNTATMLARVDSKLIKIRYLAQLWNIDPQYASAIYELLPAESKDFDFVEVQNTAKGAELLGKEAKFRPGRPEDKLVGFAANMAVYNM
jgi:catalase